MPEESWFALQIATRRELQVASQLGVKGFEVFVPATAQRRAWSDRVKLVPTPLFPGYVFCRANPSSRLLPILTTPGVIRLVGCGNAPAKIPDCEIASIRVAVASGALVWRYAGLAKGEFVELVRGPLAGCQGKIEHVDRGWALIVSISILRRSVAVEIDPSWVTVVNKRLASQLTGKRSEPSFTQTTRTIAALGSKLRSTAGAERRL